jgi:uncharacterized membrane protein
MKLHHLLLFLHVSGVVVWVGGMAFAYLCLRPAAGQLAPQERLSLWAAVFARFFPQVWLAVACILGSGLGMLFEVVFAGAPRAWHVRMLTGLVLVGVFVSVWFGPWPALRGAVAQRDWARGAVALNTIRRRVALNLALGAATILIATVGLAFA